MGIITFIIIYFMLGLITYIYFVTLVNKQKLTLKYKIKIFLISIVASPLVILLELIILILNRTLNLNEDREDRIS